MKISLAATVLILALAAGIGWPDHQRLAAATARNTRLATHAAGLGISAPSPAPENPAPVTKREREPDTRDAADRETVAKFLAWMRELKEIQKAGREIDEETQKEVVLQLTSFSPSEMEILITDLLDKNEFGGMLRDIVLLIPMMKLASVNPLTALRLLPKFSRAIPERDSDRVLAKVIETALAAGGRADPLTTLAWLRENGDTYSIFIREENKREILAGVGAKDPALAFRLIGDWEIKDRDQAVRMILSATKTPEQRTATLAAFRQHLSTIADEEPRQEMSKEAVRRLAHASHRDGGYDATTRWLATARLTPAETDAFVCTLIYSNVKDDSPKWLDWMWKNLPAEKANERVFLMMNDWTREDYQSAGKWLATAPEGAMKNAAVETYATIVSSYEPAAATQWAMTLPAGKDRDATLKQIYQNWPPQDASGKAAFAKEHGIK